MNAIEIDDGFFENFEAKSACENVFHNFCDFLKIELNSVLFRDESGSRKILEDS